MVVIDRENWFLCLACGSMNDGGRSIMSMIWIEKIKSINQLVPEKIKWEIAVRQINKAIVSSNR